MNINISVCIAVYNGEKYIKEQISSILKQLGSQDEIIVVDDCSFDETIKFIHEFDDMRIQIFHNETNKGHVYSFSRAIFLSSKDYIFLSDQDDIWVEGRVNIMKQKLYNSSSKLISSNSKFIDAEGNFIDFYTQGVSESDSKRVYKNIINIFLGKKNYYGCLMAFKKELKPLILPIPYYVESHDLWIAFAANIDNSNLHFDAFTLNRRIHGNNSSILNRGLSKKIRSRFIFLISLLHLSFRKFKNYK
jgi:glycosyltransferase involved in cell wall biosynthesis